MGTISFPTWLGGYQDSTNNNYAYARLDAAGEKVALILQVPASGSIAKIGFITGTVTTGQTAKASIQTVDAATGAPTGNDYGGSAAGTVVVANADDTKWILVTLATPATAVRGDVVALVVEWDSTAGDMYVATTALYINSVMPYSTSYVTGAWVRAATYYQAMIIPVYNVSGTDTCYYIPCVYPATFGGGVRYCSSTVYVGNKFTPPANCQLTGVYIRGPSTAVDTTVALIDTDGSTVLASQTIDKDYVGTANSEAHVLFATPQVLQANGAYRIVVYTASATTCLIYGSVLASATVAKATYPLGNYLDGTYGAPGSWTAEAHIIYTVYPIVDGWGSGYAGGAHVLTPQTSPVVIY